jgi:hypothetical protein
MRVAKRERKRARRSRLALAKISPLRFASRSSRARSIESMSQRWWPLWSMSPLSQSYPMDLPAVHCDVLHGEGVSMSVARRSRCNSTLRRELASEVPSRSICGQKLLASKRQFDFLKRSSNVILFQFLVKRGNLCEGNLRTCSRRLRGRSSHDCNRTHRRSGSGHAQRRVRRKQ